MKVSACSNVMYKGAVPKTAVSKAKSVSPKFVETVKEPDYGKGMKQLAYVIGVSVLGISSILLGTRGKFCGFRI